MHVRVSVVLAVVLVLGVVAPASGALTFAASVLMNQPGYDFTAPQIGGRYVVAKRDPSDVPGDSDIVVYDRLTGTDVSIGYGDGDDQEMPAVHGSRVVWIDHSEADGEVWYDDRDDIIAPRKITNDSRDDVGAKIDGNYIVWVDGLTRQTDSGGSISCAIGPGGGGCIGFGWWEKESDYDAIVWDLEEAKSAGSVSTNVTGTSALVGAIVPLPFIARVQGTACDRLAEQLGAFLHGQDASAAPAGT